MKTNMSKADRIIRFIVGIALFAITLVLINSWVSTVLIVLGGILVLTAVLGFCPLYALLKIHTNKA